MSHKPKILKEGFVEKKSTVLKKWRRRYFKLNGEVLCIFKNEDQTNATQPIARIFLADIMSVGNYFSKAKGRDNSFILDTKCGKTHIMNCPTKQEKDAWIMVVNFAKDEFFKEEACDPVRRKSIKLKGDLKRVKLFKDPTKGIGVRIKCVNGCVFVTRIVEDGPVAETGVLRPGDQILDVDGINVGNMTIEQVSEVLKAAPILISCTVKPANHYRYCKDEDGPKNRSYAEIDIDATTTAMCPTDPAGYEDDHSSEDDSSYISPIPSDDELQNGEHVYENYSTCLNAAHSEEEDEDSDESDKKYYVNMPDHPEQPKQRQEAPSKQSNYLELCFDDS